MHSNSMAEELTSTGRKNLRRYLSTTDHMGTTGLLDANFLLGNISRSIVEKIVANPLEISCSTCECLNEWQIEFMVYLLEYVRKYYEHYNEEVMNHEEDKRDNK